jgi:hypothetical protein
MNEHDIEGAIARELHGADVPPIDVKAVAAAAGPDRASRVAIMAELEDVRLLIEELREGYALPERKAARVTSAWSALDVIAHLASWAAETRREAESLLAGERLDYIIHFEREGGPRAWNHREVEARAARGLGELIDELNDETTRLIDLVIDAPRRSLESVVELPRTLGEPPQRWVMPLGAMILASCWHSRLHLRRLLARRV